MTVGGTKNMVDVVSKYNVYKFFHISSTDAIPHGLKLNLDLNNYIPTPNKIIKGYNRKKSEAGVIVLNDVKESNLPSSIILLAGVLGPGDYSNTHITQVIIDFINNKLPESINGGYNGGYNGFDIRDFTDVIPTMMLNAKNAKSYLFANKPNKINEVLEYVANMYDKKNTSYSSI